MVETKESEQISTSVLSSLNLVLYTYRKDWKRFSEKYAKILSYVYINNCKKDLSSQKLWRNSHCETGAISTLTI